jgi:hypothetical protein
MSTTRAMRPFEGTMPLAEARAIIDQAIVPIERTESIRVLDENGVAPSRDRRQPGRPRPGAIFVVRDTYRSESSRGSC